MVDSQLDRVSRLLNPRSLRLIVLPTERCNFRCTYCYEDFNIGRMESSTVTGLKRYLEKRIPDLDVLHLDWFGGEPLLATDIVLDVSEHLAALATDESRLRLSIGATTNGARLNSTLLDRLVNARVTQFQISLDGLEEEHNETRRGANGRGTFDRVWSALETLRDSKYDVNVVVRVHVDSKKLPKLPMLLAKLQESFLFDSRFTLMVKALAKLGGPNDKDLQVVSDGLLDTLTHQLCKKLGINGLVRPQFEPACYAAQGNSLVVRATGRLAKCTVALDDPRNDVGYLRPDGSMVIDRVRIAPWLRGIVSGDETELHCPLIGLPELNATPVELGLPQVRLTSSL